MVDRWSNFYKATVNREPREIFLLGLKHVDNNLPRRAIEIGFGAGNEVEHLYNRGWQVWAVDREEEAAALLSDKIPLDSQVTILTKSYQEALEYPFPKVSFIHGGFAFPFCRPELFPELWSKLVGTLLLKGIICGQLFGENDAWSDNRKMTFHTRDEVDSLLSPYEIIHLEEKEGDMGTATGGSKYWHYFDFVVKIS